MLLFVLLLVAPRAWAAEASWTGTWDTRWREGGARMELAQDGDRVTGSYPAYGGRIEGTVRGRVLDGRWIEGPRSGRVSFVLAPDGQSFMGRFDTGQWWTGGRDTTAGLGVARAVAIDQSGAREALRSFVLAANAARAGAIDELATAAAVVDFGPAGEAMAPGQKLAAAKALFELVDLTTFQLWSIPGKRAVGPTLTLQLQQAGTGAMLPLVLVQAADKRWSVAMPDDATLAAARRALWARTGGRAPAPDDFRRLASPRDAMRTFTGAIDDWEGAGRLQVLSTLDLTGFSAATREFEGALAAQYLDEVLDRVGLTVPQELPDDPASREPFLVFSHPAGQIVLAPADPGMPGAPVTWRFTSDTIRTARDLYAAIEDMPKADTDTVPGAPSTSMRVRHWVRGEAPWLLARSGELEAWQVVGAIAQLLAAAALAWAGAWVAALALRQAVGGREFAAERSFRWPLRLALTFLLFRAAMFVLGLPEAANRVALGTTGVAFAIAVVWGGWTLLATAGNHLLDRGARAPGSLDDILVSLLLTAAKLALLAGGLIFVADALSVPYSGVVAGLGIGGLAVAFASRETLSNVFGAAILVADRPFRRGDWIVSGDTQGTVEQVGIRSTRIRTADDSLMVVPNGKLSDATVNNLGTRRYRIARARLVLAHGTSLARVEAFLKGLADLSPRIPGVLAERTEIGVASIGPEGIAVDLACVLDVRSGTQERDSRSTLMLEVLRLADRLGIRLGPVAAPTLEPDATAAAD